MRLADQYADALALFDARLRDMLAPSDAADIVDWLESSVPSIPYSPNNGPFTRDSAPWMIEPLRACTDPEVRLVMLLACIQASKSQLLELLTAHIVAREPGPTLCLQDNDLNAKDWATSRLHVLWGAMPRVSAKVGADKLPPHAMQLPHMPLWCYGAFNERNLQRRSIRWLLGDEFWLWPRGHIAEALARLTAFKELGKAVLASQGGVDGDEGHELWKTTTQEEYGFACPECGGENIWGESGIRFPEDAKLEKGWDMRKLRAGVRYGCRHCAASWPDTNESRALLNSEAHRRYIVTNPNADPRKRGFRWRAEAVRSWTDLAEKIVRAKRLYEETGDDTERRIFRQKHEAEFWAEEVDAGAFESSAGDYMMAEDWHEEAAIDARGRVVPMAQGLTPLRQVLVDCQRDGYWHLCLSCSRDGRFRVRGLGKSPDKAGVERFVAAHKVDPQFVFLDAGDSDDEFWIWLAARKWRALRGDQRKSFPWKVMGRAGSLETVFRPVSPAGHYGASTVHKVPVFHFSNLVLKDMLARLRKRGAWALPADGGDELADQKDSERRVKNRRGEPEWQLVGKRANHLFDCAVMGLFAPLSLGIIGPSPEDGTEEKPEASEEYQAEPSR